MIGMYGRPKRFLLIEVGYKIMMSRIKKDNSLFCRVCHSEHFGTIFIEIG